MSDSVIIAGASVRSLAQSALRSGLWPICFDMFADADLSELLANESQPDSQVRQFASFAQLPELVSQIDSSIPLIWSGGLEGHTEVLKQLSFNRRVAAMDVDTIVKLRSTDWLNPALENAGCRMPRTFHDVSRILEASNSNSSASWLKKSCQSAGGAHVTRVSDQDIESLSLREGEILQEFVDGTIMSSLFYVANGVSINWGVCRLLSGTAELGASGFQYCGNIGPFACNSSC